MDSFSQYAQVRDIRMIKDRNNTSTEQYRDYGFIEFFSVEDATFVLERSKQDRLKIKG
jgi:RNA recognition motif-containing protein